MNMSVSEVAKTMGISVRTLHYYDEIGLLKPTEVTDSGYRLYNDDSLSVLQQILFFRELEFSLRDIKVILSSPDYNKTQALQRHRDLLLLKRSHLDDLLRIVDETIGGKKVSHIKVTSEEIERTKKEYAAEVKQRWGHTPTYEESQKKQKGRSPEQEVQIAQQANELLALFAGAREQDPAAPQVQNLVQRWKDHITQHHYPCTNEILCGLGQMYVDDPRFTENIDRLGNGTASFMAASIRIYCEK